MMSDISREQHTRFSWMAWGVPVLLLLLWRAQVKQGSDHYHRILQESNKIYFFDMIVKNFVTRTVLLLQFS
jgi:hypothetical protein